MFSAADAAFLRGMLLLHRPRRVLEVGSGYSTAVMLDTAESDLSEIKITCVEPYAQRLRSRLRPGDGKRLVLHERFVQDMNPEELVADLSPGDFFFIDSSHVSKAGSDVNHLLLHTLPQLPVGVHVHVHDIFWPFEYPASWLLEHRDWNECYLLHAFLMGNQEWRINLFGDWLRQNHSDRLPTPVRESGTGSIWLERVR